MYKIILPVRYLLKGRMAYFAVAATGLCVFVVFVVITVLSGLTAEFKRNTHNFIGDCVIGSKSLVGFAYYEEFVEILEGLDFVGDVSPVIKSYAIVYVGSGVSERPRSERTVEIMGIEPVAHGRVTGFGQWLYYNKADSVKAFKPRYEPELPGCVPGIDIVLRRDSRGAYDVEDAPARVKFEVGCVPLTAKGAMAKVGAGQVNTKTFYYSDHSQSGLAKADSNLIFLPFEDAQMLCGMGFAPKRLNAIHIKFKPGVKLEAGCDKVARLWAEFVRRKAGAGQAGLLKNVRVQSWKSYSRVTVAAVETEQTMMIVVFGMIGVITVFVILVVFYMIVSHKSRDIGILKSVGVSSGSVMILFSCFAFLVGVSGSAIGAVGGWRFLVHINQIEGWLFEHFEFQLWDRAMYAIGDIPNAISLKVLGIIVLSAMLSCLVGALVPSWQAAASEPVESLQVNQL